MKHTKNPYEILCREASSVEQLYAITIWCYKNASLSDDNKNIKRQEDGSVTLLSDDGSGFKNYTNRGHLKSDLLKKRARELRSVLYVRLISALEVYLIDSIKYAFINNPFVLASTTKRMEVPYSKLIGTTSIADLQWEIAEKEARNLHSAGFKDVVKYYNSQMGINIADLGINLSRLERFHDRRHLLVHRLGKSDGGYRHKYNEKAPSINIDESELNELVLAIRELSLKLSNAIETRIANTVKPQGAEPFVCKVTFELISESFPSILSQSYCFVSKDRYLRNSDLFRMERLGADRKYAMHVRCNWEDYRLIRRVLKRLERKGVLKVEGAAGIAGMKKKPSNLPQDHLMRIAKMLPHRDLWFQGIHKNLASILGISNGKASSIITSILENQNLLEALGADVHPKLSGQQDGAPDALTDAGDL